MKLKALLFALITIIISSAAVMSVPVNINSYYPLAQGPKMPFPQFINYTAGGQQTLYTLSDTNHQPDGVTHAEMEKWIRDAWAIDANRFTYVGTATYQLQTGANSVIQLIKYNSTCSDCSESAGYYLLSAAMMGDKQTFDGIWFYLVENDRLMNAYKYSNNAWVSRGTGRDAEALHFLSVYAPPGDSATDGDMDVAMAMLMAWRQWGDFTGYYAAGGHGPETNTNGLKAIKYKEMALASIRFLVAIGAQNAHATAVNSWMTGDIGFDGYFKGGQTWTEVTNYNIPSGTGGTCGPVNGPFYQGPRPASWYDYTGTSYLRCFANALTVNADPIDLASPATWCNGTSIGNWNVTQLLRAQAADAWLQGQLNTYTFPVAGDYTVTGGAATFNTSIDSEGEDFRSIWRHSLDYMLYGTPPDGWNPTTHAIIPGTGNTYDRDGSLKVYNFLKNFNATGCTDPAYKPGTYTLHFTIPEMIKDNYSTAGLKDTDDHIPYLLGSATSAIVISQDFPYMERWYRELSTLWDSDTNGTGVQTGYLNSSPKYFHDFFRLLGLLIITGNYLDPHASNFNPKPNLKIYKAVDKTYAFPGDLVTYWINYRNYGSVDASNVVITDPLPSIYNFVSATNSGSYSAGTVTWNMASLPGLKTQNYNTTAGGVTLVVQVKNNAAQGRYCNSATISCSNGTGWTSNEFPNNVSYVMQRNCVDIIPAALTITKTASVSWAKPGDTVTYTINYCDSSSAGWLDGGRSGVVFSIGKINSSSLMYTSFVMRGMHSASEPWIDWGNYRLSYFIYSQGQGFNLQKNRVEGTTGITLTAEPLVPGCTDMVNGTGCWDERLIIKNEAAVTMPTHLLMKFFNNLPNMHYPDGILTYGGTGTLNPLLFQLDIWTQPAVTTHDFTKDYSALPYTGAYAYKDSGDSAPTCILYPIGPDYTDGDPLTAGVVIPKINRDSCDGYNPMIENVLIEEWDGYCWRRAFGTGPQPGREVTNVKLIDSLPTNMTWGGFIGSTPAGTWNSGTRTIQWNIGDMLVNECGQVSYWAIAGGTCPSAVTLSAINTAFISADHESAVADSATVSISCSAPPPALAPSSLTKTANAANFNTNDIVTYTIAYTNFNGTVVDSAADGTVISSATNWTKDSGTNFTFGGGGIVLPSGAGQYHYNYSGGMDGSIYASVNMTNNSSNFGITFRNNMAFTINITGVGTPCPLTIWKAGASVATGSQSFSTLNIDIRIDLSGSNVSVYIKDRAAASWNVLPSLSYNAATLTSGNAGILNGTPSGGTAWGGHTFVNWYTSLDTAYNVKITDPVPGGIVFGSASNSGVLTTGVVTYPLVASMTKGQSLTYTWAGQVTATCCDIYNTAYAQPMGITYTVGDQMSIHVNCGITTPTFTPTYTPSSTRTPSSTPTSTPSASPTPTFTRTVTPSPTASYTPSASPSATSSFTQSASPTPSFTVSNTPSRTATFSVSPTPTVSIFSATITPTYTQTPTSTPSNTLSNTPTQSYTPTRTPTPSATGSMSPTPSSSNTPTATRTVTSSNTETPSMTPSETLTVTDTPSSNTPTATRSITPTFTITPTPTSTPTFTQTATETNTPTFSPTMTDSPTPSATLSPSPTYTNTPTPSPTPSLTNTTSPSFTPTTSATPSSTPTLTGTRTLTSTPTASSTRTSTPTFTTTSTFTPTLTLTPTPMPSPVNIDIQLLTGGEEPKVGGTIHYTIQITNNTSSPVDHISVWDSIPTDVSIQSIDFLPPLASDSTSNYLHWDNLLDDDGNPFILAPNGVITISYTVVIGNVDPNKLPLTNRAAVDYNDPVYIPSFQKHWPLYSEMSFFPLNKPVVYPNPFKLSSGTVVKFGNIVPGSMIRIFTLSGESVQDISTGSIKTSWDGKNKAGQTVSPGIYYFTIYNPETRVVKKGKLFVVR